MSQAGRRFPKRPTISELRSGDRVIGRLVETEVDPPWIDCSFTPGPAWSEVVWIFDWMLREMEAGFPGEEHEAMNAYRNLELRLHPVDNGEGEPISPMAVWIEGDTARYRY